MLAMAWRRPFSERPDASSSISEVQSSDDSVQYIGEKGGNDAPATYQDASGAPVEHESPLGYSVGPITITLLNITMMIGAGIYSTRESGMVNGYRAGVDMLSCSVFYSVRDWLGRCELCLVDAGVSGK